MAVPRRAVVLAGGLGTRVRDVLPGVPKPMAPVAGRPFLEWVARFLARQGVREAVFSTGHLSEIVERHFSAVRIPGISLRCRAEPAPLGTAGGFLNAIAGSRQGPPWLVLNGDSLAIAALDPLYDALAAGAAGAMLCVKVADAERFGTVEADGEGFLKGFFEKRPGRGLVSAGICLFADGAVRRFPEQRPLSLENQVLPALASSDRRIRVCPAECPFLDIGSADTLPRAEAFITGNLAAFEVPADA